MDAPKTSALSGAAAAGNNKSQKNKKKKQRKKAAKAKTGGREGAPGHKHGGDADSVGSYRSEDEGTDISDSDFEGNQGYKRGGYHPVYVGEVYNRRYTVLRKLGWGHFSTVWLCSDGTTGREVAMKVQKSAKHYTDAAFDEIQLLQAVADRASEADAQITAQWEANREAGASARAAADAEAVDAGFGGCDDPALLASLSPDAAALMAAQLASWDDALSAPAPGPFDPHVVRLLDSFTHDGPHGRHVVMVFGVLGDNLLALIKAYRYQGIPLDLVRKFARQTALGLDFLHSACNIIHTDLKPENVLLTGKLPPPPLPPDELEGVTEVETELTPEERAFETERLKVAARKAGARFAHPQKGAGGGGEEGEEDSDDEGGGDPLAGVSGAERRKLKKKLRKRKGGAAAGAVNVGASLGTASHRLLPPSLVTANFVASSGSSGDGSSGDSDAPHASHASAAPPSDVPPAHGLRLLNAAGAPIRMIEHAAPEASAGAPALTPVDAAAVEAVLASPPPAPSKGGAKLSPALALAPGASTHASTLLLAEGAMLRMRLPTLAAAAHASASAAGKTGGSSAGSWVLSLAPPAETQRLLGALLQPLTSSAAHEGGNDDEDEEGADGDSLPGGGLAAAAARGKGGGKKGGKGGKGKKGGKGGGGKQAAKAGPDQSLAAALAARSEALATLAGHCVFIEPLQPQPSNASAGSGGAFSADAAVRALAASLTPQDGASASSSSSGSGSSGEGGGAGAVVSHAPLAPAPGGSHLTAWRVSVPSAHLLPALTALEAALPSTAFLALLSASPAAATGYSPSSGGAAGGLLEALLSTALQPPSPEAAHAGRVLAARASLSLPAPSSTAGAGSGVGVQLLCGALGVQLSGSHGLTSAIKDVASHALTAAAVPAATSGDGGATASAPSQLPLLADGLPSSQLPPFAPAAATGAAAVAAGTASAVRLRPLSQRLGPWGLLQPPVALTPAASGSPASDSLLLGAPQPLVGAIPQPAATHLAQRLGALAGDIAAAAAAAKAAADAAAVPSPSPSPPAPSPSPSLPPAPVLEVPRTKKVKVPRTLSPEERSAADDRYAREFAAWEEAVARLDAVVVDLGNACWSDRHFSEDIQTRQYRSPEVILGTGYDASADVWSLGCMVFELLTGDLLFDPAAGDGYDRDEDHLAQMLELAGPPPSPSVVAGGARSDVYFTPRGTLRHIHELRLWGPASVLTDKYGMSPLDAALVESFLLPTLAWDPAARATAEECLLHPWLAMAPPAPPGEEEEEGGGPGGAATGDRTPAGFVDWRSSPALASQLLQALLTDPVFGPHVSGPTSSVPGLLRAMMAAEEGADGEDEGSYGEDGDEDGEGEGEAHHPRRSGARSSHEEQDDDIEGDEEEELDEDEDDDGEGLGGAGDGAGAGDSDGGDGVDADLAALADQVLSLTDEQAARLGLAPPMIAALRERLSAAGYAHAGLGGGGGGMDGTAGGAGGGGQAGAGEDDQAAYGHHGDDDDGDDAAGEIWGVAAGGGGGAAKARGQGARQGRQHEEEEDDDDASGLDDDDEADYEDEEEEEGEDGDRRVGDDDASAGSGGGLLGGLLNSIGGLFGAGRATQQQQQQQAVGE